MHDHLPGTTVSIGCKLNDLENSLRGEADFTGVRNARRMDILRIFSRDYTRI